MLQVFNVPAYLVMPEIRNTVLTGFQNIADFREVHQDCVESWYAFCQDIPLLGSFLNLQSQVFMGSPISEETKQPKFKKINYTHHKSFQSLKDIKGKSTLVLFSDYRDNFKNFLKYAKENNLQFEDISKSILPTAGGRMNLEFRELNSYGPEFCHHIMDEFCDSPPKTPTKIQYSSCEECKNQDCEVCPVKALKLTSGNVGYGNLKDDLQSPDTYIIYRSFKPNPLCETCTEESCKNCSVYENYERVINETDYSHPILVARKRDELSTGSRSLIQESSNPIYTLYKSLETSTQPKFITRIAKQTIMDLFVTTAQKFNFRAIFVMKNFQDMATAWEVLSENPLAKAYMDEVISLSTGYEDYTMPEDRGKTLLEKQLEEEFFELYPMAKEEPKSNKDDPWKNYHHASTGSEYELIYKETWEWDKSQRTFVLGNVYEAYYLPATYLKATPKKLQKGVKIIRKWLNEARHVNGSSIYDWIENNFPADGSKLSFQARQIIWNEYKIWKFRKGLNNNQQPAFKPLSSEDSDNDQDTIVFEELEDDSSDWLSEEMEDEENTSFFDEPDDESVLF